jgi:high-affinity iron transporter
MLATLVIGLREGLEAALIVGIIAAFLRRNGQSLLAMWLGVALAVALSVAVGIGLDLVEQALPQARQEGMESIIGVVAIFFVTGMIMWMNTHAAGMKKELEAEAAEALGRGSAYALAGMAFLAVLREGFETSVFLLATFSAAQSALLAAAGACIGLLMAVAVGWGIYAGGVRVNLSRFFRFTGAFLILVAAGLVITSLRAAHEAGWLNAGQQATVNLSWLVAPGTVQSALVTGVLGIPADPRRVEVIGWLAYLIPVALYVLWPPSRRIGPRPAARLRLAIGAALGGVALGLAALYPSPRLHLPAQAPLISADGSGQPVGSARLRAASDDAPPILQVSLQGTDAGSLRLPEESSRHGEHDGVETSVWGITHKAAPADAPATLTLDQVVALAGGRIPVGLSPARHPGPFTADWSTTRSTHVWAADGALLDAAERSTTVVALSGGGLRTPRTLTIGEADAHAPTGDWRVSAAYRDRAVAALNAFAAARTEHRFWAVGLPLALAIVAFFLTAFAGRTLIRLRRAPDTMSANAIPMMARHSGESPQGATHATR